MQEYEIQVKGIECVGCENRIQNAVGKLEQVESVRANHSTGTVTVCTEEKILPLIKETIEDLGFQVVA